MPSQTTANDRLDGWEAISSYLGWTPRTAIRWEKQKGLPVHRVPGGKRQPVYAFRHEIDAWYGRTGGAESNLTSASTALELSVVAESPVTPIPRPRVSQFALYAALAVTFLVVSALGIARWLPTRPAIRITSTTRLTDDGMAKRYLVTDGKQLYFGEAVGADVFLCAMRVDGGPVRRMTLPIPNPLPLDISPDGKFLLVFSVQANEEEYPLWVVPTAGGPPSPMVGVKSRAAAWAPSGAWIAFGSGEAIYLISPGSGNAHLLSPVSGFPEAIRWSADGKQLIFNLRSRSASTTSLWQLDVDANYKAKRLAPIRAEGVASRLGEMLIRSGDSFIAVTDDSTPNRLLQLRLNPWWGRGATQVSALNTQFGAIGGLAADADARKLFILTNSRSQGELVRYAPSARTFTMLLAENFATFADFTKNMSFVTYVKTRDGSLWMSKADGSDARQLTPADIQAELPRWSPDGERIAFMGRQPNRPWRIFVVSAEGGVPKEASHSDDNQGAPTWSPDGRSLSYGNVLCLAQHTCAIHTIDLASGEIATLPDSQGLATARWSPDGLHIAALNPAQNELDVFDLNRRKWRRLAEEINGNDVSWSSDSKYVYSKSSTSGQTEILRVPVGGGPTQTVLNLDSFSKAAGQLDTWFSLTPDNALVLNRWLNTSEIYALNYSEQ